MIWNLLCVWILFGTARWMTEHFSSVQFVEDGIYGFGKAHVHSTTSFWSFHSVAFQTVPVLGITLISIIALHWSSHWLISFRGVAEPAVQPADVDSPASPAWPSSRSFPGRWLWGQRGASPRQPAQHAWRSAWPWSCSAPPLPLPAWSSWDLPPAQHRKNRSLVHGSLINGLLYSCSQQGDIRVVVWYWLHGSLINGLLYIFSQQGDIRVVVWSWLHGSLINGLLYICSQQGDIRVVVWSWLKRPTTK